MSKSRRRIAVVTGTRAEYGLLGSTLDALARRSSVEVQLVVTGIHLLPRFGRTIDEIKRDRRPIAARIPMQRGNDDPVDQAEGLARGVNGMARFFVGAETQIVLVLGDRIEALAGALAATTTGRVLVHVHGGDVAPGDFDGPVRDAITKLAHLHLPATEQARRRIIQMGEDPSRVHCVGAPGLDQLVQLARHKPRRRFTSDHALVLFHPCGRSAERERKAMTQVLNAVAELGMRRSIIYPNTDRGHTGIIEAIEAHARSSDEESVCVFRSLPREQFLKLLVESRVLVGNSSSGIIESAAAGTPAVNVGLRQSGRERAKGWVYDAEESRASILSAIRTALAKARRKPDTSYGDGRAGERIAKHLASVSLSETFHKKVPVQ